MSDFKMISTGSPIPEKDPLKHAIPNPEWENAVPIDFLWRPGELKEINIGPQPK